MTIKRRVSSGQSSGWVVAEAGDDWSVSAACATKPELHPQLF